jgi:hypothetical protein
MSVFTGKTSGRSDDNIESIKKRFRTYINETTPVLQYYDFKGLVSKIDGTREVEAVWTDSSAAIEAMEKRFTAANSSQARSRPLAPRPSSTPRLHTPGIPTICAMERLQICVHMYSTNEQSTASTEALVARVSAEAGKRFGEGKVTVSGRAVYLSMARKF